MDSDKENIKIHPWYKKIKLLDLSKTKIIKVPNYINSLKSLQMIDLSSTGITEIRAQTFVKLPKLKVLNLSRNKNLTTLHPKAFYGLHSLENLDLSNNRISEIRAETFVKLPKLKNISFLMNRYLSALHPKSFYYLPSLEILNLRATGIRDREKIFRNSQKVKELYL